MVEVFKTNVKDIQLANMLVEQIHNIYKGYRANFDLDDCDKILRVKSAIGEIQSASLVNLLKQFGFQAEVLADEVNILERYAG